MQCMRRLLVYLRIIGVDSSIRSAIYNSNTMRVIFASGISIILHLFFIFNLYSKRDIIDNPTYLVPVISSHIVMLIIMVLSGGLALTIHIKRPDKISAVNKISYVVALSYMILGVIISLYANLLYLCLSI